MKPLSVRTRWLLGSAAFLLPLAVAKIGLRLDHSAYRHHPVYRAVIPYFAIGAVTLAVIVPSSLALIAAKSWRWRLGLVAGILVLLAVQLYAIFVLVLMNMH